MELSGRSSILDLPIELIESIAHFLSRTQLLPLRLVCNELTMKISGVFARSYFTNRIFLLSDRTSMDILRQLSKHKIFAQYVKRVELCPMILREGRGDYRCRETEDMEALEEIEEIDGEHPPTDREQRIRRRDFRKVSMRLCEDETAFIKSGENVRYLSEALENFATEYYWPEVVWEEEITDMESNKYLGFKRLQRLLGYSCPMCWTPDVDSCGTLYRALADTAYCVKKLTLGSKRAGMGFWRFRQPLRRGAFALLSSLDLTVDGDDGYGSKPLTEQKYESRLSDITSFLTFLAYARRLTHLRLAMPQGHLGTHSETFAALVNTRVEYNDNALKSEGGRLLPRLRDLTLHGHSIPLGLLLRFISGRRRTLERVKLRHIRDGGHSYPDLEEHIRKAAGGKDHTALSVEVELSYDGGAWIENAGAAVDWPQYMYTV